MDPQGLGSRSAEAESAERKKNARDRQSHRPRAHKTALLTFRPGLASLSLRPLQVQRTDTPRTLPCPAKDSEQDRGEFYCPVPNWTKAPLMRLWSTRLVNADVKIVKQRVMIQRVFRAGNSIFLGLTPRRRQWSA
jgi:hypothetical protein